MKSLFLCVGVSALLVGFAGQAKAVLVSGSDIIPAPTQVLNGAVTNSAQQAFNERQGVLLLGDLSVDNNAEIPNGGTVAKGEVVDSHMIFFNITGNPTTAIPDPNRVWKFDGPILGVMSDQDGALEFASNNLLGAAGTTYPTPPFNPPDGFRGLEVGGPDGYSVSGSTITVDMNVSQPGDWIRVITRSSTTVPTLSEWGMVSLLLLLLVGVTIYFGGRRWRAAA